MDNVSLSAPSGDDSKGFVDARFRTYIELEADSAAQRRRSSFHVRWLVLVEKWLPA